MGNNKIITSQGNVQFINSKGRTIEMHPMHCYAVFENDTVSFLFINMKEYSGQAFFASQFEDVEVNGETYDSIDALKDAITEAFAKAGAQARTEIVETLPQTGLSNTIYLVPKSEGVGYDEYIYIEDGQWELIGDTDIELDRYLQKADFNVYSASTDEYIGSVSGNTVQNATDIASISGSLDTEISAREAADSVISGAVDNVSASLANEASRAISAETALGGRIDTINGRVNDEQTARATADNALSGAIDSVISDLASDVSARTDADTALQTAIDNEVSARTVAIEALEGEISGKADTSAVTEDIAAAVSGKQDTLIAGEHITISGNVISAEAGTVPYDGYSYIEIFTGDTLGLDKIDTPFYVVSGSQFCFEYKGNGEQPWGDFTCALLDWTNHTSSFQEQGAEEYVSVTWSAKYNAFKFDTLQEGHDITHVSERNWGYGVDAIPSGTTNETFDNVIEYVIDSDNALNSKFNNYLTTSDASNTYLAKNDSVAIKYTQDMFERGQTNIKGGIVSIQNGFEYYIINIPYGSEYSPNYGKGILRESFVLGMGNALATVLWYNDETTQTWVFGIPQAEVFNGGLVGRKVFVIWDKFESAAIYFKCENATITSGETQIDFSLSGKIYYDDECTKEYKTRPNWFIQGTVIKDGEVNGDFSAQQLERDGFFGDKTQKQGVFYDENGGKHKIPFSFNTYSPNGGRLHQGISIYTYCLVNKNINGNFYLYTLNGSLVSYQSKRIGVLGFSNNYMNVNVPLVDYSKLTPIGFEYVVNDDSTDNQGTVGVKYKKTDFQVTSGGLSIWINYTSYTLVEYSETEHDLVYNDESVSGVYTITVDEEGYRTLMVSDIEGHHFIQGTYNNGGGVETPTTYYVHYTNGTSQEGITSGEVQTMINSSISGKADTTAVTQEISSAVSGKQDTLISGTNIKTINNESILGSGNIIIQGGGGGSITIDPSLDSGSTNAVANSAITNALSSKVDTSSVVSSVTSASTDSEIPTAKAVWEAASGGGKAISAGTNISVTTGETADTINCTIPYTGSTSVGFDIGTNLDARSVLSGRLFIGSHILGNGSSGIQGNSVGVCYGTSAHKNRIYGTNLVGIGYEVTLGTDVYKTVSDSIAIGHGATAKISNAVAIGSSAVASGTTQTNINNQLTIDTSNQVYIYNKDNTEMICLQDALGGDGSSYSAGTNISIDTANTISCTLNITNGSGVQSLNLGGQTDSKAEGMFAVAEGVSVSASSIASHAEGFQTLASGLASHAEGGSTKTINDYEHASGQFNVSLSGSSTFGDSGNTLFSVGNGTADDARHNAFEIRQNGDIYITSGGTDIKLQDQLGGGLKLVKLSQQEYDGLTTKDANTVYFVGDSNGYTMKIGDVSVN